MKKSNSIPEKPVSASATVEPPVASAVSENTAKNPVSAQKAEQVTKPEATKAKVDVANASVTPSPKVEKTQVSKAVPKKPSQTKKVSKKPENVVAHSVAATPDIPVIERTGLTAGSIWHFLAENGTTSVAKLIKELPEEEKIIQRSIGWLAQEGKITLSIVDRVETIALKE